MNAATVMVQGSAARPGEILFEGQAVRPAPASTRNATVF
jgi:hypothetical protein